MNTLPAKLCDLCTKPGACCTNFRLSLSFWDGQDIHEQWAERALAHEGRNGPLQQFVPSHKIPAESGFVDEESGCTYSVWRFRCTALQPNGRCGMYENRPLACRDYKAGSDALCVMYRPQEQAA